MTAKSDHAGKELSTPSSKCLVIARGCYPAGHVSACRQVSSAASWVLNERAGHF